MLSTAMTHLPPLMVVRVLAPAIISAATLSLLPARPAPPSAPSPITSVVVASRVPRRAAILAFLSFVAFTYLLDGLTFVVFVVIDKSWPKRTGIEIGSILGLIGYAGLAAVGAWKDILGVDVWSRKRISWSIFLALALDITQVILFGVSIKSRLGHIDTSVPLPIFLHLIFPVLRVLLLLSLLFSIATPRIVYATIDDDETLTVTSTTLLLPSEAASQPSTGLNTLPTLVTEGSKYGTFLPPGHSVSHTQPSTPTTGAETPIPQSSANAKNIKVPETTSDLSWAVLGRRLSKIVPYLWPSKSRTLQLVATTCILILLVRVVVNGLVPFMLGAVINAFVEGSNDSVWPYLFAYVGLRYLQSSGGLNALRDTLWAPVMQYSDREMSQLAFDHILNLSFAFHTRRKTGEVLRILDRGSVINHTLELGLFSIVPTFLDIIVALFVFVLHFDWTLGTVIFFVMFAYVYASVILTKWRTKIRRAMNERDVVTRGIHTDCLLNYETVKYFGGEVHESERYREALHEYQALEYKVIISLNFLNLVQNLITATGLLIGSMIVALRVTRGESQAKDFVIFITFLAQLYNPLNQLGSIYRALNQSLVDTEKLLDLLNEPTDVNDKPGALDLVVTAGTVEFDNVSFSYDGRNPALKRVSFKVPNGSSVALVGESGAGKSTILRLLYRFYDLGEGEGRILIDGQDIRDVTQASLRKAIGVVPQDSVLFNSSIKYNIAYGKFGASDEEVEAVARAAQMHERITSFPDGYETKVGERGVRLSGGEKQRVAIARTLLKNPPILLLDEATSALDTSTEKDIQKALQNLVKGRSSISIAHRLSTIASADLILVLKDGQIVEQGNHKDLLAQDGIFATMWADQVTGSDDPAVSIASGTTKREVSGYSLEPNTLEPVPETKLETADASAAAPSMADNYSPRTVEPSLQNEGTEPAQEVTQKETPEPETDTSGDYFRPKSVTFPALTDEPEPEDGPSASSDDAKPANDAPLAFPSPEDNNNTSSAPSPPPMISPNVTFGDMSATPERSGTPDPDAEPKRKRISSQNFQRLARKMSISNKRQGSTSSIPVISNFPGFRRDSPRGSMDTGRDSATTPPGNGSQIDKKDKKDKKDKEKKKSTK